MQMRKLRGGMIGGGIGAFIGPVHRMAIQLDAEAEIVAGAFSRDRRKSEITAAQLYLDPARTYSDFQEMAKKEAEFPSDQRLDFIVIVSPNATHYEIAKTFLDQGFHVVCEKPVTTSLEQAKILQEKVRDAKRILMLAHAYTGYPMIKQAKQMVKGGDLGAILKVVVEYYQGWVPYRIYDASASLKPWKFDPAVSGSSLTMADIGIHAENLARYVTGMEIEEVCAETSSFMAGHGLEDDGNVLIRYRGGAKGVLNVSQMSTGEQNGLVMRVYGERKSLIWKQETPDFLVIRDRERFDTILYKGGPYLCKEATAASRLPIGHPDGLVSAFANLYQEFFATIRAQQDSGSIESLDFPTIRDGVIGMAFVETVLESARSNEKWIAMKT